ncbi:mannose-1-phosphate guanylyltransferase [Nocardioides marmoriginsengisoli]|uniref:Mannose-1-phosphate guanylyltransferase n=1 Tax=Nocardioides marmoriginsengisoli TaxID=661483 RepID=A0A3N0CIE5_9ACTN|nr:mannose-1-phosphate guanylyltransferase [Nocardioides marmoriginsengisoli]RNL63041.1 mannose-1-phosphate guanylyltransferase [Nocardioides marmoriginsengisoli]
MTASIPATHHGDLWAVVPAGGAGTRLWPLSRAGAPKFLHDLAGDGRTLLQATYDRLQPLVGERLLVVTGAAHQVAVRGQLAELPADQVIAEPSPRDSMAAIGLAAAIIERQDPDAVIGSFAADHVIADPEAFRACVTEAAAVARTGLLVTLGITPDSPSTGFGYIRLGERLDGFPTAHAVDSFVEKPDADTAQAYVDSGDYRWNAGMFVARASVVLDLLAENHPDLARDLRAIAAEPQQLDELWDGLTKIAIDHAIAEPAAAAGKVAVVPGSFGWEDIGDFEALTDLTPAQDSTREGTGIKVLGDAARVFAQQSSGLVVTGTERTIAVLGLENVVVVDTGDAVLVTTTEHAQDVKSIVEALKAAGRADLT